MDTNAPDVVLDADDSIDGLVSGFLAGGLAGSSLRRTIEWVDTDAAGHQHNSVILRFVEAAEARLFRDLGQNSYFGIAPRVRHETDYRAKLYFGQAVTTAVRIERIGTSSMDFAFRVWGHPHEGRGAVLAAEGRFVTVCVPLGAESSAPWPEAIRAALGA
ncbi:acyl-CoA thioesterase [Paeniglutamicibacter sp. R2-26]|uniref:acyl-CoA thioesterase n=1 Tax=Paeniglutamicibacter sp. R2-26 TaxID=3144417 RepID=UPI003EE64CF5